MKSKKILLCLAIGVSFLFENNGYAAEKIEWIGDGTGYRNSLIVSGGKKLHFCGMEDKDYRVCYYYTGTSGIKPENKEAYKWFEMPKRERRKSRERSLKRSLLKKPSFTKMTKKILKNTFPTTSV